MNNNNLDTVNTAVMADTATVGRVALDNAIYISDKAKSKVINLMKDAGLGEDPSYFLRVGVVGGG